MLNINHEDTKTGSNTKYMFNLLSSREELLAKEIVDIAISIHKQLGPGLLESVYAKCFYYELKKREISYEREKEVPIIYNSLIIDEGLRLDLLIENLIIVEFKAQEIYHPVHVPLMKNGIKRMIL